MTQLYHTATTAPAPLPHYHRDETGKLHSALGEKTEAELAAFGFFPTPDKPAYDPASQRVRWGQTTQAWSIEDLPQETLAEAKLRRHGEVHARYSAVMSVIGDQYPPEEREGWAEQVSAAQTVIDGGTSDLIDALRAATGETAAEMAQTIMTKRAEYRVLYGAATGNRRALDALIDAATTTAEVEAVDLDSGWPVG